MKIWISLLFLASLAYGLIQEAPANKVLPHLLPPEISSYEISGPLMRGKIGQLTVQGQAIDELSWNIHGWNLLLGSLVADVEARPIDSWVSAEVHAGLGDTVEIHSLKATSQLASVQKLLKLPFLPLSGQISVDMSKVEIQGQVPHYAEGSIRLGQARWTLARPHAELGDVEVLLSTENEEIIAQFDDSAAKFSLAGNAKLLNDGAYRLDAKIKAKADTPVPVSNNMKALGRTDSQGWYSVKYAGSIKP